VVLELNRGTAGAAVSGNINHRSMISEPSYLLVFQQTDASRSSIRLFQGIIFLIYSSFPFFVFLKNIYDACFVYLVGQPIVEVHKSPGPGGDLIERINDTVRTD
jgi:hypothetical protein